MINAQLDNILVEIFETFTFPDVFFVACFHLSIHLKAHTAEFVPYSLIREISSFQALSVYVPRRNGKASASTSETRKIAVSSETMLL